MSQIIHFAKQALARESCEVVHGHVDEIYASVLGFKTKAALGRPIDEIFEEIEVLIADKDLAVRRAERLLGESIEHAEAVVNILLSVLEGDAIPSEYGCTVYESVDEYFATNYDSLSDTVLNDGSVIAEIAMTYAYFNSVDFENFSQPSNGKGKLQFNAFLSGEQDPDKVMHGSNITVDGEFDIGPYRNLPADPSDIEMKLVAELELRFRVL